MSINSTNSINNDNPLIYKTIIKFIINDEIEKQVVKVDTNEVIREIPSKFTSQILKNLYG